MRGELCPIRGRPGRWGWWSAYGATASARLYSLIETAKANGHEPYRYLRYLFTELPKATTPKQIDALLPTRLAPEAVPAP